MPQLFCLKNWPQLTAKRSWPPASFQPLGVVAEVNKHVPVKLKGIWLLRLIDMQRIFLFSTTLPCLFQLQLEVVRTKPLDSLVMSPSAVMSPFWPGQYYLTPASVACVLSVIAHIKHMHTHTRARASRVATNMRANAYIHTASMGYLKDLHDLTSISVK